MQTNPLGSAVVLNSITYTWGGVGQSEINKKSLASPELLIILS
jgi:hypothetical protein